MGWGRALPPAGQSATGLFPLRVLFPTLPAPIRSCFLPTGCAGGIGLATCGLAPAYFATRRYLTLVALTPTADGFLIALLAAREVAAAPRTGTHRPLRRPSAHLRCARVRSRRSPSVSTMK